MLLSLILTLAVLLLMAFQDIKSRSIMLILFFFLAGIVTYTALSQNPVSHVAAAVLINLFFVALQMLAVFLYLFFKYKTLVNPFAKYLGWGDVLLWIAISPAFSPMNYILMFLVSALFALCTFLLMRYKKREEITVPLAGLQALFYAGFFLVNFLFLNIDCHDDSVLISLLL